MSKALNFCFLCILLESKRKEIISEELQIAKKEIFIRGISILIYQNLGLVGHIQQKIKLPSPN